MNYLDWNNRIAKFFFNSKNSQQNVSLAVSRVLINELGGSADSLSDFILALKSGPSWAIGNFSICDKAIKVSLDWRERKLDYPPSIGYLSLFVLAAENNADHASSAYYNPLRRLLGEGALPNRPYPRFERMVELWEDLAIWSRVDKQGSLGLFRYSFDGSSHVAIPRDQYLSIDRTRVTKLCPQCKRVGTVEEGFGWRRMHGKTIPQSWCYECRGGSWKRVLPEEPDGASFISNSWASRTLRLVPRIRFTSGDSMKVTLMPRKVSDMKNIVEIRIDDCTYQLSSIHDHWYSDISLRGIGEILRSGLTMVDDKSDCHWKYRGQSLLLGQPSDQVSGYLNLNNQMYISEKYIVMCVEELKTQVEMKFNEIGAVGWVKYSHSDGAPDGWVCYRGVVPRKIGNIAEGSKLSMLNPKHRFEVSFLNGVQVGNSTWLHGYPPDIFVSGVKASEKVLIDGLDAWRDELGRLKSDSWDKPGKHTISCFTNYCTYEIFVPMEDWQAWDCHLVGQESSPASICGALLFSSKGDEHFNKPNTCSINTYLVGARPGEIAMFKNIDIGQVSAHESSINLNFTPVLSIPSHPIQVNRKRCEVHFLVDLMPHLLSRKKIDSSMREWAKIILEAGRKGLLISNPTEAKLLLWRKYRDFASYVWRCSNAN